MFSNGTDEKNITDVTYGKEESISFSYTPLENMSYKYQNFKIEVNATGESNPEDNYRLFGERVAPQSRLYSTVSQRSSGNLSIIVERYNYTTQEWSIVPQASLLNYHLTIEPQEIVKLDLLYNPLRLMSPYGNMPHRVRAEYVDEQRGYRVDSTEPWQFWVYQSYSGGSGSGGSSGSSPTPARPAGIGNNYR